MAKFGLLKDQKGATSVEYSIIVSLIAGVVIIAVAALGLNVKNLFETLKWW